MASNLHREGLEKVLKDSGGKSGEAEHTINEVNDDWKRLASFMSGKK